MNNIKMNDSKKTYEKPEFEITRFEIEDSITSSGGDIIDVED